ncbi:MAG TPA: hypothetical protein VGH54_02265 [Mycobacterium sp.]|uniref:hypothetical protein n=1 Tax=Mycobacterium sp. TaxID=1785 RepID=UPI002F3F899D
MQTAVWFLLLTAVGIPAGNAISTWISNHFNRGLTQKTALLTAAQRRRDAEIAQLRDCQAALLDAATAVQSYVLCVDKKIRLKTTIPEVAWPAARGFVERAVVGAQRLRAMARATPSDELHDAYTAVADLIMKVVQGSDDPNAADPWDKDVSGPQPDTITRAVNATADAIKELYDTYPAELGAKPASPQLPSRDPNRSIID